MMVKPCQQLSRWTMRLPPCPEDRGGYCWECHRNRREGHVALGALVTVVLVMWALAQVL